MGHRRATLALFAASAILLAATPVRANGPDVFGLGSDAVARGGAMTAVAEGHDATFYNPGGLAFSGRRELVLGYQRYLSTLEIHTASGDTDQPITFPDSLLLGATLPIGDRVAFGISSVILPDTIVAGRTHGPEQPVFPYYDNRTQRLALFPALGVRLADWIAVGVGANFFAGLEGAASASEGPTAALESTVFEEIFSRAALHAGVRLHASETLRFGLTYRQAFHAPFTTRAAVLVSGVPIDVLVDARTLVTPHELALGAALRLGPVDLSLDATWLMWSQERSPFTRVTAIINGVRIQPPVPEGGLYRDTLSLRAGGALDHRVSDRVALVYRLGAHFEPTMVEDQPGRTNLLDGHKIELALGAGVVLTGIAPRPIHLDLHASGTLVTSRRFDKRVSPVEATRTDPSAIADEDLGMPGDQITNPGYPWVSGDGMVFTLGVTATFELPE